MRAKQARKTIGKVAALEKCPTTIDSFCFWTNKDTLLNPFDVVVVDCRSYDII